MATTNENDYEDPPEAALRTQLGLRPTHYPTDADLTKGGHPDQRPCPPWCFVNNSEYGHEIHRGHPTEATHSYDVRASVVASLYPGGFTKWGDTELLLATTIEAVLDQVGQQAPEIEVALRRQDRPTHKAYAKLLRLSVADARELVAVLQHLVEVATGEAR